MFKNLLIGCAAVTALAAAYGFSGIESGLKVGESVTPFNPSHISGPDKGTDTCPPCKYGSRPAVQAWIAPQEKAEVVAVIGRILEGSETKYAKSEFQGFMIMLTRCQACVDKANTFVGEAKTKGIGIATLDVNNEAVKNYKVNTAKEMTNTIFIYKDKKVVEKFVNWTNSKEDIAKLEAAIAKASS
jgi:protocatechuate 3,4-dioxygenase beta subunit